MFAHDRRKAQAVIDDGFLRVRQRKDGWWCFDRLADRHALTLAGYAGAATKQRVPYEDYDALLTFVSQYGLGLESAEITA